MKDKIKKLLILASDKGATEHEAARALEMAQALMLKYNIEIDLNQLGAEIAAGDMFGVENNLPHHKILASAVAVMYTCKIIQCNPGFKFVGRPESIDACQATFNYLSDQIEGLWKTHLKEQGGGLSKEYRYSFRLAASSRVYGRIYEMMQAVQKDDKKALETTGCTALVVVDSIKKQLDDIEGFMEQNFKLKKARLPMVKEHHAGTGAGRQAGESVQIQRKVKA